MACKRVALDYLDYFFCSRNVCCDWSIVSAFITEGIGNSHPSQTIQASTTSVVVLFAYRLLALSPLSRAHICSVDILFSLWTANFSDCEPMVHFSNVVLAGLRVGPGT